MAALAVGCTGCWLLAAWVLKIESEWPELPLPPPVPHLFYCGSPTDSLEVGVGICSRRASFVDS